jgi:gliding motility-associated-like protein
MFRDLFKTNGFVIFVNDNSTNSMKFFRIIFIFILLQTITVSIVFCQTIPVLEEVSVVAGTTGNVQLKWSHVIPSNVYIFRDTVELGAAYQLIDSVKNTSILEYTDTKVNAIARNRQYKLRSAKDGLDSKRFPTQLLSSTYDSCKAEIYLNWTNSVAGFFSLPDVNFLEYEIWVKENSGSFKMVDQTTNKNYTLDSIKEKTNYTFYIAAIPDHAPDSKSTSNTISFYSEMAQTPAYIESVNASVTSGYVNLSFTVDPNSELTKYKIVRSTTITGPFDTVKTIETNDKEIQWTDTKVNTDKNIYYYKLIALNNCDIPVIESDIINTIKLKAKNNDKINTLTWNAFKESTSPLCNYRVYRILGNDTPLELATLFQIYTFEDNIEDLVGSNSGSEICYFVYGWESLGGTDFNNSNIDCVYLEPKIYIPEAFTPNGDGNNDIFDIKFSFLPSDYTLLIYNRWSNVVFESTDPEDDWDGLSISGKAVPAGAYIYYLKIVTDTKQTIEKRGNITVLYP